jgi:nucleoside-diphosphate-sugar epimerase
MKSALVIGNGQIGSEIAAQLAASGTTVRIATRSGGEDSAVATHVRADASDRAQLAKVAEGVDAIFACAHAPYDSRKWEQLLPRLDAAVLDTAADLGVPVIFPESVYAFAGLSTPITESSPFAPVEDKGRIRQQLLEARAVHSATNASVIAGDLLGRTAETWSSVVRMCITEPISHGRRAFFPARSNVPHGITVIADHATAMIRAAEQLEDAAERTHRLHIAPASNPTLAEIVNFTADLLGQRQKRPISVPRWVTRAIGVFERSFFELNQLSPIWYEPCIIEPGDLAAEAGTTDWREGVKQMLGTAAHEDPVQQRC